MDQKKKWRNSQLKIMLANPRRYYQGLSLKHKMRCIVISLVVPLAICMIVMLCFWGWYVKRNSVITHNVNVSSKFSIDFKQSIDLKMYHFMVGSKLQKELPIEDVEEAILLAKTLQDTTVRKESKQAIRDVVDYCENLEEKMYRIAETQSYDSRKQQLEKNIYILSSLIQEKMMDYMYYEAGYLALIENQMIKNTIIIMLVLGGFLITLMWIVLRRSFRFTESITQPIVKLCENMNLVGMGEFDIASVKSTDYEIAYIDEGIQRMAQQIERLLENVKEEEKLQHKTQLQLLQAQVSPHFLYNTLDTIIWMVESGESEEAVEMLTNLSIFFRTSLSKGEDVISLKEEMYHTRSYLDIQQVRYRDILQYEISWAEEMNEIRLPKLTLQPLVENALYHGIKEKREIGTIKISCINVGEDLCIVVEDNGVGILPEKLEKIQNGLQGDDKVGFGLAAVQGRLKLYFGEHYGIKIASEYQKGVRVEVLVPKNIQLNG